MSFPATPSFTGRSADLDRIEQSLDRVPVTLICGMPGVGKTALLAEMARRSSGTRRLVWVALSEQGDLLDKIDAGLRAAGETSFTPHLAQTGLGFDERLMTLCALLRKQPYLVVLDDLHALGVQEACSLISRIALYLGPTRLLAASRVRLPVELAPGRDMDELTLGGLGESESLELFGSLLGERISPHWEPALREIARAVEGHPFTLKLAAGTILEESIPPRALLEGQSRQGGPAFSESERQANVSGMLSRDLLGRVYTGLSLSEKRLLAVLAAFRGPVPAGGLESLAGPELLPLVQKLEDRFLVERSDAGQRRLHPLLREFTLSRLDEPQRRRLQLEVANWYQANAAGQLTGKLEYQVEAYQHALLAAEDGVAYRLLLGFLDELLTRGRYRELAPMLERALATIFEPEARIAIARARMLRNLGRSDEARRLLEQLSDRKDPKERSSILAERGLLEQDAGRYDRALKLYYPALELAQQEGARALSADLLARIATVCKDRGEYERAIKLYEQSLEIERREGTSAGAAYTLHSLAKIRYYQGDHEKALTAHLEALELWEKAGDRLSALLAKNGVANILRDRGLVEQAEETYRKNLAEYRELVNPFGESYTLANLGHIHFLRGEHGEAIALLERSIELSRTMGNRMGEALALDRLGDVRRASGQFLPAREHYERSLAIHREMRNSYGIAITLNCLGDLERETGAYGPAMARYDEALGLCRKLRDKEGIARALEGRAILLCDRGDHAAARSLFDEALTLRRQMDEKRGIARALSYLGYVAGQTGETDRAYEFYKEGLETFRSLANKKEIQRTLGCLAELAAASEDYDRARELATESLELARALDDAKGEAIALTQLGRIAHYRGESAEAVRWLESSLERREKLGDQRGLVATLEPLAAAHIEAGKFADAARHLQRAVTLCDAGGYPKAGLLARAHQALIALRLDHVRDADRMLGGLLEEAIRMGFSEGVAYVLRLNGFLACRKGQAAEAANCLRQSSDLYRKLGVGREKSRVDRELVAAGKDRLLEQLERRRGMVTRSKEADRELMASEGRLVTAMVVDLGDGRGLPEDVSEDRRKRFRDEESHIAEAILALGGEPVKVLGASLLAMFADPVKALECARLLRTLDGLHPRIGLQTGKVLSVGKDIFGEPVDHAARFHGMARPGELLLGDQTYSSLPEPKPVVAEAEPQRMRGREEKVRVWKA